MLTVLIRYEFAQSSIALVDYLQHCWLVGGVNLIMLKVTRNLRSEIELYEREKSTSTYLQRNQD